MIVKVQKYCTFPQELASLPEAPTLPVHSGCPASAPAAPPRPPSLGTRTSPAELGATLTLLHSTMYRYGWLLRFAEFAWPRSVVRVAALIGKVVVVTITLALLEFAWPR